LAATAQLVSFDAPWFNDGAILTIIPTLTAPEFPGLITH